MKIILSVGRAVYGSSRNITLIDVLQLPLVKKQSRVFNHVIVYY
jgi:hypothetical protein